MAVLELGAAPISSPLQCPGSAAGRAAGLGALAARVSTLALVQPGWDAPCITPQGCSQRSPAEVQDFVTIGPVGRGRLLPVCPTCLRVSLP